MGGMASQLAGSSAVSGSVAMADSIRLKVGDKLRQQGGPAPTEASVVPRSPATRECQAEGWIGWVLCGGQGTWAMLCETAVHVTCSLQRFGSSGESNVEWRRSCYRSYMRARSVCLIKFIVV